jgi:hypothetical protein
MKKNRPAILLSVLAPGDLEAAVAKIIMEETTTLGIRVRPVTRHIADRESRVVNTILGPVNFKIKRYKNKVIGIAPEYDECRKIAKVKGIPLKEVYRILEEDARTSASPLL